MVGEKVKVGTSPRDKAWVGIRQQDIVLRELLRRFDVPEKYRFFDEEHLVGGAFKLSWSELYGDPDPHTVIFEPGTPVEDMVTTMLVLMRLDG